MSLKLLKRGNNFCHFSLVKFTVLLPHFVEETPDFSSRTEEEQLFNALFLSFSSTHNFLFFFFFSHKKCSH